MNYAQVIIKPLITEKTVALASNGKYTFIVNPHANKEEVRIALKKIFGVNAKDINIIRYRDHKRRINYFDPSKGSIVKKTINYKKAVVRLGKDEKLDYFDIEQ